MPEEPVCKLAPLIDRFQKIGELVTSIGGVDFPHDTAGTAVGQDAVYLPVYLLQIFQCLYIFTGIWHFFRPPGASFDPEHSSHSAQQPILLFEVGGLRIKDAILNVVGRGSSHREPGKTTEGEDRSAPVIYGHMMYDETMFGPLRKYRDAAFFKENNVLRWEDRNGEHFYKFVAGLILPDTADDTEYIDFRQWLNEQDAETTQRMLEIVEENAYIFQPDIMRDGSEKYLFLMTCTNNGANRLLLVAERMD